MSSRPTPPSELAGRWLTRFFTSYLAGERAASPRTIVAYRDAIKLLLTWFKDTERIPPEKLRLADIDRPRSCGSWTGWRRSGTAGQRPATSVSR